MSGEPLTHVELDLAVCAADIVAATPNGWKRLTLADLDWLARAARELAEAKPTRKLGRVEGFIVGFISGGVLMAINWIVHS